MDKKPRVWIYCRVGSQEQLNDKPDIQETALRLYADKMGYAVAGVSSDVGSVNSDSRPGLQEVLEAADKSLYDILLTSSMSRIARNMATARQILLFLTERGINVHFQNMPTLSAPTQKTVPEPMAGMEMG